MVLARKEIKRTIYNIDKETGETRVEQEWNSGSLYSAIIIRYM